MTAVASEASCILFLDFDGVTHPDRCPVDQLFCRLPLIETVVRDFDRCLIVISSSWRLKHPFDEMQEYFSPDIQRQVIGMTPLLQPSAINQRGRAAGLHLRQAECERWLMESQLWLPQGQRAASAWIAVDDRPHWFRPDCNHLLATDGAQGFTERDAGRLRAMLAERVL